MTMHLLLAQANQKHYYDQVSMVQLFQVGNWVLAWALLFSWKVTREWEGPFTIMKELRPMTYEVHCGYRSNQLKVLHVNHLKNWYDPDTVVPTVAWSDVYPSPLSMRELPWVASNTGAAVKRPLAPKLTAGQKQLLNELLADFATLFSSTPGRTTTVWHVIETPSHRDTW